MALQNPPYGDYIKYHLRMLKFIELALPEITVPLLCSMANYSFELNQLCKDNSLVEDNLILDFAPA